MVTTKYRGGLRLGEVRKQFSLSFLYSFPSPSSSRSRTINHCFDSSGPVFLIPEVVFVSSHVVPDNPEDVPRSSRAIFSNPKAFFSSSQAVFDNLEGIFDNLQVDSANPEAGS